MKLPRRLRLNPVPLLFIVIFAGSIWAGGLSPFYVLSQVLTRFDRYAFLALALVVPVVAGLGLNFGIVIGAMAGQAALIMVTAWGQDGLGGFLLGCVVAVPIAIVLGFLVGLLFNRARGKEMITGLFAGFFANGIYQLVFLFCVGTIIPYGDESRLIPRSEGLFFGIRNTFELKGMHHSLDRALDFLVTPWGTTSFQVGVARVTLSLGTWLAIALLCLATRRFLRSKLGQELRAMGQDYHVAEIYGIRVNRNRVLATVISTVLAAWGQMIYLQNLGEINTYNSHEIVGMVSVAALLTAGASVDRATIWHALVGVLLFHSLYVALPQAAARILDQSQLGEYLRVAVMYGVITFALALHAIRKHRAAKSG